MTGHIVQPCNAFFPNTLCPPTRCEGKLLRWSSTAWPTPLRQFSRIRHNLPETTIVLISTPLDASVDSSRYLTPRPRFLLSSSSLSTPQHARGPCRPCLTDQLVTPLPGISVIKSPSRGYILTYPDPRLACLSFCVVTEGRTTPYLLTCMQDYFSLVTVRNLAAGRPVFELTASAGSENLA